MRPGPRHCLAALAFSLRFRGAPARVHHVRWSLEQDLKEPLRPVNDRPIIGVMTQRSASCIVQTGVYCEYLPASYVKWVESAGARVVPVPSNASQQVYDHLLGSLNGFLIPGGANDITWGARYIVQKVIDYNDAGDYFPLWGTCMGFEWISQIIGDPDVLQPGSDSEDYPIPLNLTADADESRLFSSFPRSLVDLLRSEPITFNNHELSITPNDFTADPHLGPMFRILSTNIDKSGRPFVSTVEGRDYPIYGVQWHPEKAVFEWGEVDGEPFQHINHSAAAVAASQQAANFFVAEARRSSHTFVSPSEEDAALIYNCQPQKSGPGFVQTYILPDASFNTKASHGVSPVFTPSQSAV